MENKNYYETTNFLIQYIIFFSKRLIFQLIFNFTLGENNKNECTNDLDDIKSGSTNESQVAIGSIVPLQGSISKYRIDKICATVIIR